MYYGGYPATISSGYSKVVPTYSKAVAPYGKASFYGKPFGVSKSFTKPFVGKPFAKPPVGKPFAGKPFSGKSFAGGFPATKSAGYNAVVPATTVTTGPSVI